MNYQHYLFGPESAIMQKMVVWAKVVAAINSEGVVKRTEDTCLKWYYDIKRRVKSKMAKEAKPARQTVGVQTFIARYLEYEEPMWNLIPPEVVAATHDRDSDRPSQDVLKKSKTTRPPVSPTTSDDDDDDAVAAGHSTQGTASRRRPPEPHKKPPHVAPKRPRSDVQSKTQMSPSQNRISIVSLKPPHQILDTPPRHQPHSPHLDESTNEPSSPPTHQQDSDMDETFVLHLQPINEANTPPAPVSTPPPQHTPPPQQSPTTPSSTRA
ncbi:uncharacterized protein LOC134991832 [Pseudophryne corroboree]|uniref:uncharacterized protein LOC134991832 n=1 Tax=Pseudophryne corroboree TaxID=495146 RepID=UPI003081DF4A